MKNFSQPYLQDKNQNFWQLASIQSTAQSIPAMLIGGQLAKINGIGSAINSVCIGNLVLWVIGLTMIVMASQERKDAIENVRKYLGKKSGILASLFLIVAFLTWFMIELRSATIVLNGFFQHNSSSEINLRLGASLGLIIALLSIGGIRLIKWICVVSLPLLLLYILYTMIKFAPLIEFKHAWSFSLTGMVLVAITALPGFINLPTFFRHSRSKFDSFLAITFITIFDIIFEIFSISTGFTEISNFTKYSQDIVYVTLAVGFTLLSLTCLNLVNIYFASAGWETIIPHHWSSKEYAIVGLLGTAAFTFFQISYPMSFLGNFANNSIACLGIVLMIAFLIKIIVRHRPRPLEQLVSVGCWLIGCITSVLAQIKFKNDPSLSLIAGISASIIAFLCVVFIEETIWSFKKVFVEKKT